jgi:hypothetical protein
LCAFRCQCWLRKKIINRREIGSYYFNILLLVTFVMIMCAFNLKRNPEIGVVALYNVLLAAVVKYWQSYFWSVKQKPWDQSKLNSARLIISSSSRDLSKLVKIE